MELCLSRANVSIRCGREHDLQFEVEKTDIGKQGFWYRSCGNGTKKVTTKQKNHN